MTEVKLVQLDRVGEIQQAGVDHSVAGAFSVAREAFLEALNLVEVEYENPATIEEFAELHGGDDLAATIARNMSKELHTARIQRDQGLDRLRVAAANRDDHIAISAREMIKASSDTSKELLRKRQDSGLSLSSDRLLHAEHGVTISSLGRIGTFRAALTGGPLVATSAVEWHFFAENFLMNGENSWYTASNYFRGAQAERLSKTVGERPPRGWIFKAWNQYAKAPESEREIILPKLLASHVALIPLKKPTEELVLSKP